MKKLLFLLLFLFPGIVCAADITSKEQLNQRGITIGVSQGSVIENFIKREFPNASIAYYTDGGVLGYQAVAVGKIDAYVADLRQMEMSLEGGFSGAHLLDETMNETLKTAIPRLGSLRSRRFLIWRKELMSFFQNFVIMVR